MNLIENNTYLFEVNENMKQDKQFNNNIIEQTLLGPNFVKIKLTNKLEKERPK